MKNGKYHCPEPGCGKSLGYQGRTNHQRMHEQQKSSMARFQQSTGAKESPSDRVRAALGSISKDLPTLIRSLEAERQTHVDAAAEIEKQVILLLSVDAAMRSNSPQSPASSEIPLRQHDIEESA